MKIYQYLTNVKYMLIQTILLIIILVFKPEFLLAVVLWQYWPLQSGIMTIVINYFKKYDPEFLGKTIPKTRSGLPQQINPRHTKTT